MGGGEIGVWSILCCGSNSNSSGEDGEAEFLSLVRVLYFLSEFWVEDG